MALNEDFNLDQDGFITNFTEINTPGTSIIDTSFTPSINRNPNYVIYADDKKHVSIWTGGFFGYNNLLTKHTRNLAIEKGASSANLSFFATYGDGAFEYQTVGLYHIAFGAFPDDWNFYKGTIPYSTYKNNYYESTKNGQKAMPTIGYDIYNYTGENYDNLIYEQPDQQEVTAAEGILGIYAGYPSVKYLTEATLVLVQRASGTSVNYHEISLHQFAAATKSTPVNTTINGITLPKINLTNIPRTEGPYNSTSLNNIIGIDKIKLNMTRWFEGTSQGQTTYTWDNETNVHLNIMFNNLALRNTSIQVLNMSGGTEYDENVTIDPDILDFHLVPNEGETLSNNLIASVIGLLSQTIGYNTIGVTENAGDTPNTLFNVNVVNRGSKVINSEPYTIDFGFKQMLEDYANNSYDDEYVERISNAPLFVIPSFGEDFTFNTYNKTISDGYDYNPISDDYDIPISDDNTVLIILDLNDIERYASELLKATGYAYSEEYYDHWWHPGDYQTFIDSVKVPVINPNTGYHTGEVQPITESQQWAGDNPLDSGYNGSPFKPPSPAKLSGDKPTLRDANFYSVFTSSYVFTTVADLKTFAGYLWPTDDNRYEALCKAINFIGSNPIESIVSLQYYPFVLDLGEAEHISLGRVYIPQTAPKIADLQQKGTFTFANDVESSGNFLDCEPYASYIMYLPFAGYFNVPSAYIVGHKITGNYVIDVLTGTIGYQIKCDDYCFMEASGQCSVFMPVTSFDSGSYASGVLQSFIQGQSGAVQNQMITESMSNQEKNRQMNYEVTKANQNASLADTIIGLTSDMMSVGVGNAVDKSAMTTPSGGDQVWAGAKSAVFGMANAAVKRLPDFLASRYNVGIESGRNDMQSQFYNSQSNKQSSVASYSNMSAALSFATAALSSKTQVSGSSSVATLLNAPKEPFIIQMKNDVVKEGDIDIPIGELLGYEVRKRGKVKDFNGYTVFANVKLDGVNATEDEKAILLAYLQAGVFI